MRTLTSFLFMSLDGVIDAPDTYVRPDLYPDFIPLIAQTIAGQDAVLLGRTMYEEWSGYWPTSDIQPFADFINHAPKFVVSKTLVAPTWQRSTVVSGPLDAEVAALKNSAGGTIGVHGSIRLVQSLLAAGLLDELRLIVCPVVVGRGRRLSDGDVPIQLDLVSAQSTSTGLQYLVYRPR